MRSPGWSGAATPPYSELEYGGFRHTVSAALSAARGAQGESGRIETAHNQKLRVTVTVHFIDSMIVLWRRSACETPRASASQTFALSGQSNLLNEQRAKQKN